MKGYKPRPAEERFWSRVLIREANDCWLWLGCLTAVGYGNLGLPGRKSVGAHRFSWALANGPIPDGLWVLHRCDVRHCVNPSHLFLGTVADNQADMKSKGRAARGSRVPNSKLSPEHVLAIRASDEDLGTLARRFNISKPTICDIRTRRSWAWL